MKRIFYASLFFLMLMSNECVRGHSAVKRLQYGSDWNYQPILINGEEILTSDNASGGTGIIYKRYEALKQVLNQYDKPFTVLDLGANNGFFSLKIAEDFDAICVVVDGSERLTDICTLNTDRNKIIHFQKRFNKKDIKELARREHFDVVLALLVLHHVDDWRTWVDTLFELGDNLIIETPSVDDPINSFEHTKQFARYITSHPHAIEIGAFPRGATYDHMLWFCQNANFSNTQTRKLGISPSTFFYFNGAFPTKSYVQELNRKIRQTHGTKRWILQGIDFILE